jgi:serine protease Do
MPHLPPVRQKLHRLFLILVAILTCCIVTACQTTSLTLDPNTIAELTKTATVLIETNTTAEVNLSKPEFNTEKSQQLQKEVVEKVTKGELKNESDVEKYVIESMINNLSNYLKPGETLREKYKGSSTGTGVSLGNGTIATADHVTSSNSPKAKRRIIYSTLKSFISESCKGLVNKYSSNTRLNIDRLQDSCIENMIDYVAQNSEVKDIKTEIFVWQQPAQPGPGNPGKRIPAELIKAGESIPGKDSALLKIPGDNQPSVPLGDDKSVKVGDTNYSNGFPGNITKLFGNSKEGTTLPEPTFNSGTISARRTINNSEVLQTNVPIQAGNSGGGIYNNKGELIGLVSFASTDDDGKAIPGSNFMTPISVTQQQLKEVGITPTITPITERYRNALDLLQQKKARKALQEFQTIRDLNPNFPYIQAKISEAQKLVPDDKSLPDWAYPALTILAIGGLGGYIWTRRNPKPGKPNVIAQLNALLHRSDTHKASQGSETDDR